MRATTLLLAAALGLVFTSARPAGAQTTRLPFTSTFDAGNLSGKYDVIILPSGAVPAREGGRGGGGGFAPDTNAIPAEFRGWMGRYSTTRTMPALKQFVEAVGSERLLFGSLFYSHPASYEHCASLEEIKEAKISNHDKANILALNTRKLFKLA